MSADTLPPAVAPITRQTLCDLTSRLPKVREAAERVVNAQGSAAVAQVLALVEQEARRRRRRVRILTRCCAVVLIVGGIGMLLTPVSGSRRMPAWMETLSHITVVLLGVYSWALPEAAHLPDNFRRPPLAERNGRHLLARSPDPEIAGVLIEYANASLGEVGVNAAAQALVGLLLQPASKDFTASSQ